MTDKPIKKLFIQTHGCQMNEYDSSRMADLLEESHQLVPTDNAEDADVLLLNTCSIEQYWLTVTLGSDNFTMLVWTELGIIDRL